MLFTEKEVSAKVDHGAVALDGCDCSFCKSVRYYATKERFFYGVDLAKNDAADATGYALKTTGALPPRIKPADLHDKGEKAPGRDLTNPKDRLGVLKLPLRFIPAPALAFLAKVMELGAIKYGPFNWRDNKVKQTVYLEAALRHLFSVLDGEDVDLESGQPHEAHVMACMAIILDARATGNLLDDRYAKGVFANLVQTMQKKPDTQETPGDARDWLKWLGGRRPVS